MKKNTFYLLILIIVFLIFIIFTAYFSQQLIKTPKNLGEKILLSIPLFLEDFWQGSTNIFEKIKEGIISFWNSYIQPITNNFWQKINSLFKKEVEKKKTEAREEFEKEKQEMKAEIFELTKWLWEKTRDKIKEINK